MGLIRAYCIDCSGGSKADVKNCAVTNCPLYEFRFGTNPFHVNSKKKPELVAHTDIPPAGDERRSPAKAIRANCIECCKGSKLKVKLCADTDCNTHKWRLGANPDHHNS